MYVNIFMFLTGKEKGEHQTQREKDEEKL